MERQFKLGDEVLARRWDGDVWIPIHYGYYDKNGDLGCCHVAYGGHLYKECIPMEGNEHLAGTRNPSPDKPSSESQGCRYKYLEEVEANRNGSYWEPAHYIGFDGAEGKAKRHQVALDNAETVVWLSDESVRPRKKQ